MNKEEINKLLEELKYNIPQDYVRSCDTTDGIGYYEDDEYSWQYQLHRYITNLQNQVEKLTQENNDLENLYITAIDNLSKSLLVNGDLKERIGYLERINNRKEETIIELRKEQELDKYKSVIDKAIEYIEDNGISYLNLAGQRSWCGKHSADKLLEILRSKE